MSGIAEVLHNLGYEVTGSDLKRSSTTKRLKELGIRIHIGHNARNIDSAHVVVISSAVREDNPEVVEAKRRAIPVIPRAEMLAELGRLKYSILVAGSHGKTTTTSLIAAILSGAGLDPTVVIGGRLKATGTNARLGQGDFVVAEADESDGSFLKLSPTIALATSIDREHMDYFRTMDALCSAFGEFLNKVPFYGLSILCYEDPCLRRLVKKLHRKFLTYGFSNGADLRTEGITKDGAGFRFTVKSGVEELGEFRIPLIGMHNILNTLGAIAVARELRIDPDTIRETLLNFSGIQRRFEFKGETGGVKVYDDYGHHPTEIQATIKAIRESFEGRLIVVFQPHRYTRTKDLLDEFARSFRGVSLVYLMDIYPAGEKPIKGINAETLYKEMKKNNPEVKLIKNRDEMLSEMKGELREGDLLLTLGAGDVWKLGERFLKKAHKP